MAILAECPGCHKRQANRNKKCPACGRDLDKARKAQAVRYWIVTRLPNGKQKWELSGNGFEDAKAADGKRKAQKIETPRILNRLSEKPPTFKELTKWHTERPRVTALRSFERIEIALARFNQVFGDLPADRIKPEDLEDYQERRTAEGAAAATIDMELSIVGTMVRRAFDNRKIDGEALRSFRCVKRLLAPRSNDRARLLDHEEYSKLCDHAPAHVRPILIMAYNTGMRRGEILGLRWSQIDREAGFIRLESTETKEKKPKSIPVNHHVRALLKDLDKVRAIRNDHVFTNEGEAISMYALKRALVKACKGAGIVFGMKEAGGFRFHDIRTTVKTNMLRAGVDKVFRDTILGHALHGMDAYYLKPTDEDLKSAMEKYTVWLDGEISANALLTNTQTPPPV